MASYAESLVRISDRPERYFVRIRFGGGTSTKPDPGDIDLREDAGGKNFVLSLDNTILTPRKPFQLKATATNAAQINGFVEFTNSSGVTTNLIQAGGNVYSWDGDSTFTLVGTVDTGARLRGGRYSTSQIDDIVLIHDLALKENILTWDGSTLSELSTSVANFKARYCVIVDERAFYGNVSAGGTATPHLIVASQQGTSATATAYGTVTTTNRPSSSLAVSDPFYLPTPDGRAVNGLLTKFGKIILSTKEGRTWYFTGTTAKDFALTGLFEDSFASGDEAIIGIGNDILYGRPGRIDTMVGSDKFGDVKTDDPSRLIADQIADVKEWTIVFNPRLQRAYLWPLDGSELWTFTTSMYSPAEGGLAGAFSSKQLSPWSKWTTDAGDGDFRQTAAALMRRPGDNLDVVLFGGMAGQIYELEGEGTQDAGTDDVPMERITGFIGPPLQKRYTNVRGYINHKKNTANTITLKLIQQGVNYPLDVTTTLTTTAVSDAQYFGDSIYFGGSIYFGSQFAGRIVRLPWQSPGSSSFFQLSIAVSGIDPEIQEVGIYFDAEDET